jgi:hypothetical protein
MHLHALASSSDGVAFLFFGAFVLIAIVVWIVQSSRRKNNLEIVARKFQGRVTTAWLAETDLELTVDGTPAHLSYYPGSKNRSAFTRIRFDARPPGRLRLVPDGFWESLKRAFGSEDLQVGNPTFDPLFIIQGAPVEWVRQTLDPATQARIVRLHGLGTGFLKGKSVSLEAGPAGVVVGVPRNLVGEVDQLEAFIHDSIAVFRRIREPVETVIQFLPASEYTRQGLCPVCEHPFDGNLRKCEACATPHHADCWEYFGGCSTYACAKRGGK